MDKVYMEQPDVDLPVHRVVTDDSMHTAMQTCQPHFRRTILSAHHHHGHVKSAGPPPPECFIETPCTRSCGDGFKLLLPNPNGYGCYGASLQGR